MNFRDDVNHCREHVAGMGLEVVVRERGVEVGEGLTVFSSSKVPLKGYKFRSTLQCDAMVDVVVIHVAVHAVSRSANAAGNGGGIKADGIGQGLQ